jgi:CoA:oxalate CoA-transferase
VSILSEHFRTKTKSEWVEMIAEAGVPCGPINGVDDVINDPQVEARGMIVPLNHPRVPDMKAPGSPIRLADMPASVRRPPADLGEHTQEVLCELGYSQQEIVRLKNEGVT